MKFIFSLFLVYGFDVYVQYMGVRFLNHRLINITVVDSIKLWGFFQTRVYWRNYWAFEHIKISYRRSAITLDLFYFW